MVHYEPVKITINAPDLADVIIDVIVRYHGLPDSIIIDQGSLFMSKFWSLLCYFLDIKRKLSTAFHLQTDGQAKRQNSTIEAYLRAFVNWKQNDWARFLLMAEFAYNNAKNASTGHTLFELNYGFHLQVSFEDDVDPRSKSRFATELAKELKKLVDICQQNLFHAQKLQKKANDKGMKPESYALGEKVWLNSKYIKTKQNSKLEAKFFRPFQILHPVEKQTYKLDLLIKWKIYNIFYVSLLEKNTIRKRQMNELFPKPEPEFDVGNNKEYKVEAIIDSAVYAKEAERHLPGRYYLVSWKSYPEEESTRESSSTVMHLQKMISTFHKDHPKKPTATFLPLNSAPPMAKPWVKPPVKSSAKQKWGRPTSLMKWAKEWDIRR